MTAPAQLLSEGALRRFVRDGYVTVQTGLPRAFHEDVRRRLQEVFDEEGNPGNNILPRVPELQRVVDDPAVRGALTSILGPTFVAHPHRHCHLNLPGSEGQRLHKDTLDFSGDKQPPHHRPRWAIAFYYPQDVTEDMGPTGIAPGTQYFLQRPDERAYPETTARGPAGTVTIVQFDIWHRGTPNRSSTPRFMVKFEFGRMDEPQADGAGAVDGASGVPLGALWSYVEGWLRGRRTETSGGARNGGVAPGLAEALRDGDEATRLGAAYALGAAGEQGVAPLAGAMRDGGAVGALAAALRDETPFVRFNAATALARIGPPAAGAVPELVRTLDDPDRYARGWAALALRRIGTPEATGVLLDRLMTARWCPLTTPKSRY